MLNVLSLSKVSKRYKITMDTASSSNVKDHLDNGTMVIFEEVKAGLYLINDVKTNHGKDEVTKYSNLNLVRDDKLLFTKSKSKVLIIQGYFTNIAINQLMTSFRSC